MSDLIVCVVPSIRPDRAQQFRDAWSGLFDKHGVQLILVWDGETPLIEAPGVFSASSAEEIVAAEHRDLFFNFTDSVRNYGFVMAAKLGAKYILTLDDDVAPPEGIDPIAQHLAVLDTPVTTSWLNTAPSPPHPHLRGIPYGVRDEATVKLSHGVWTGVPDFDAATQLQLGNRIPRSLPYHIGPIPKGAHFAMCGMNVMVKREALPWFYYAPMGPKAYGLNRFGDIWCGIVIKHEFDMMLDWAIYTGASTVVHTRASDVYKNLAAEAEGLRLNEDAALAICNPGVVPYPGTAPGFGHPYWNLYADRRHRYAQMMGKILGASDGNALR